MIDDALREATQPLATQPLAMRALAGRIMRVKAMPVADSNRREPVQKTPPASLNRANETIARVGIAGAVSRRLI